MRLRRLVLRLIAVASLCLWTLALGLVLQSTAGGGSLSAIGPLAAGACILITLVGLLWPPPVRPGSVFGAALTIGIGGIVLLVGSLGSAILGSDDVLRGVRPSAGGLYPWALALLAIAVFSGLGVADRSLRVAASRRTRAAIGVLVGLGATLVVVSAVIAATGTTAAPGAGAPSSCRAPLSVPAAASVEGFLVADIDLRAAEEVKLAGTATGQRFMAVALAPELAILAQDLGTATVDGRDVRHCRIHTTGSVITTALPETAPIVGDGNISRWRGELDYWVAGDGAVVLVDGSIGGEAFALEERGLIGDLAFRLSIGRGDQ